MFQEQDVEELITVVSSMDRQSLTSRFLSFEASFPVDFTPEFLQSLPVERLRHIYVALCLQARKLPAEMTTAA